VLGLTTCCWALLACSGDVGQRDDAPPDAPAAPNAQQTDPTNGTSQPGVNQPGATVDPSTEQPIQPGEQAMDGQPATTPGGAPSGVGETPAGMTPSAEQPAAGAPASPAAPTSPADCSTPDVSASVLARLSRLEYQLTLEELFQLSAAPAVESIPQDSDFKGFRTMTALQNITTEHLRAYQEEATTLALELLADAARSQAVIGCDVGAAGCLESFISDFGRLAYRRTLSGDDVAALMDVVADSEDDTEAQFVDVVAAMLTSPSFLFRMEVGDATQGLSTLSGEELASKLSFALTGRGPSKDLLDRGAAGEFADDAGLANAAAELLADSRSQEFFAAFFEQWLGFERLRAPNEPGPNWNDALMISMKEETHRFLEDHAWQSGVNFLDSLTANYSYIRADMAEFYGLPAPAADGRVEFPSDHDRANSGLLTHAALISAKGDGDRIAHRGAWIQKTFLCVDLELPTALLDSLSEELDGLTYPAMLEMRNTEGACAGCHALIDPIGMGFHPYDAAGQFDPEVDIYEYGITPALPGDGTFERIGELSAMLRNRPELSECLTDRVFLYTGGREASAADACTVTQAAEQFDANQGRFASILEGLVLGPQFRLRRAPLEATN
jgi:hypothetical protein